MLLVEWNDASQNAAGSADFDTPGDVAGFGGLATCEDIGFLVRHDAREVVLSTSRCLEHNDTRGPNTIPRGWITKIAFLEAAPCAPTTPAPMAAKH